MSRRTQMVVAFAFVMLALIATAPGAQATPVAPVVYPLTSDHCTGGCGTPPFGTVALTQSGLNVHVVVTLNSPNFFVKTGAGDGQWFLFNATGVVAGDITVTQNFGGNLLVASAGSFGNGGVGSFGFGITCDDNDCGNGAGDRFAGPLIFDVANATVAELTVPNASGNVFVADIISCTANACAGFTGPNGTGNTGLVDATTPTTVPEPGTLALVGSGLVSFGIALRRRWSRRG